MKILERKNRRNRVVVLSIVLAVVVLGIGCLFVGSFHMSFGEAVDALTGGGQTPRDGSPGRSGYPGCWRLSLPAQAWRFPV